MSANEDERGLQMSQPCDEWEALRMAAVSAGRWAARRLAQRCSTWQLGRTGEVSVHVGPGDSPVAEWLYQSGHAVAGQPGSGVLVPVELTDQDLHPAEDAVRKARSLLVRYAYASAYGSVLAEEAGVTTTVRMEATEHSGATLPRPRASDAVAVETDAFSGKSARRSRGSRAYPV